MKKQKPKTYEAEVRVDMTVRMSFDAASQASARQLLEKLIRFHLRVKDEVWLDKQDAKLVTGLKRPKAGKIGVYSEEEFHVIDIRSLEVSDA